MLIGITGHKQAGKDSTADILMKHYCFEKESFAEPIKRMALALDPIVNRYGNRLSEFIEAEGWEQAKRLHEIRRLLQRLGTEAGRHILGEDIWVDALFRRADLRKNLAITDVRFLNEARAVRFRGGTIWKVTRPGYNGDDHDSEREVDEIPVDIYIPNTGTLKDLKYRVLRFMERAA